MFRGLHGIVYTERAEELRAFLRDRLGLPATDVGGGWLIFPLGEAELACHPTDTADGEPPDTRALSLYCDDLAATVAELARRGVPTPPIEDHGFGLVTFVDAPGGHRIQLYQPSYAVERPGAEPAPGASPAADAGGEAVALLRHTLATLAYRGAKTLRDAPASFSSYRIAEGSRTALAILAHIGDLLDWAATICDGQHVWEEAAPRSWEEQVERFFAGLRRLDARLARAPLRCAPEAIFQGPIADALTHVGQLNMMRRLAGAPVRGENYNRAEIVAGRVGAEQAPPRREFD